MGQRAGTRGCLRFPLTQTPPGRPDAASAKPTPRRLQAAVALMSGGEPRRSPETANYHFECFTVLRAACFFLLSLNSFDTLIPTCVLVREVGCSVCLMEVMP